MKTNNGFFVADQFRTNELSLVPGGSLITIYYQDGSFRIYDKIKKPSAYIRMITDKDNRIVKVEVDNKTEWIKG